MNLHSDHKLQKSNHSSNSAKSSEQQDMLMKALGPTHPVDCFLYPTHPIDCFLYAMSSAQN